MTTSIKRHANLPANIVQFIRHLRTQQFELGTREEVDAMEALAQAFPRWREDQQSLFKALLTKNKKDFLRFDAIYEAYWKEVEQGQDSKVTNKETEGQQKAQQPKTPLPLKALKDWLYAGRISDQEEVAAYSAFEAVGKQSFSFFPDDEHGELRQIIRQLTKRLANKHNRRFTATRKPVQVDLRNSVRQSLMRGGQIDHLVFKKRKQRRVKFLLLCDVSKSMELYSKFLIDFMYSFTQVAHRIHTFVFSTRLYAISSILEQQDFSEVLRDLSDSVPHWFGGTCIGASFAQFCDRYTQLLDRDTIVFILSDGWDTGDTELLAEQMQFIHKKSGQVVWFNPLAGYANYQPETLGMAACLPYVDVFSGVHNVDTLRKSFRTIR